MFKSRFTKTAAAAMAAATTMFVGVAYAAFDGTIMGSDGVINACAKADGVVRLAGSSKTCDAGEKAFNFSQRGQTGPTGPQGAAGAPGPSYFVRIQTTDDNTTRNTSRTPITTWSYSDYAWVNMPNIDVRKCAISATANSATAGATVTRAPYEYDHWILLYTNVNGSRAEFPIDVTIACPE
jgi:hypothetical protein